jgi:hypothetical protein
MRRNQIAEMEQEVADVVSKRAVEFLERAEEERRTGVVDTFLADFWMANLDKMYWATRRYRRAAGPLLAHAGEGSSAWRT